MSIMGERLISMSSRSSDAKLRRMIKSEKVGKEGKLRVISDFQRFRFLEFVMISPVSALLG